MTAGGTYESQNHASVVRLTSLALLAALVVVLQTVASGIRIGPVPISLTLVPIVVGAILFGPGAGAGLGAVFGVVCLIAGITGADEFTNVLWVASPFWLVVVCVGKAVLCGLCAGLVAKALRQRQTISCILAALTAPVVNTGVFAIGMLTVFKPVLQDYAGGTNIVYFLFVAFIGVNFLVEFAVNAALSAAIARIVQVVQKQLENKQHPLRMAVRRPEGDFLISPKQQSPFQASCACNKKPLVMCCMTRGVGMGIIAPALLPRFCRGGGAWFFHGAEDVLVARAAAQVAGEELAQFVVGVFLAGVDDLGRRQNKARDAEAALDGGFVHEGLLHVGKRPVRVHQAFKRDDVLALGPDSQIQTGVDCLAVNECGARAAFADLTALFTDVSRKSLRSISVRLARTSTIFSTSLPLMLHLTRAYCAIRSHLRSV